MVNNSYYLHHFTRILTVSLAILALLSPTAHSKTAMIAARVNNQIITTKELENRIAFSKKYIPGNVNLSKKSLTYNVLDEIIEEYMIDQEAKRVGVSISKPELDRVVNQIKQSKLYKKLNYSKSSKLTTNILESKVRSNIIWSKILSELVKPSIKSINNPQIIETLEELDRDVSEFKFNISQIKIEKSQNTKLIIDKMYQELITSNKAEKIMKIYKKQDILFNFFDIGWVSKDTLDKKIYDALLANKDKSYTKPMTLNNEYVIFKINKKILSNNISEKDYTIAQDKIYQSLKISDGKGFLRNLRKRTFVEIYRSRIDKYMDL